MRPMGWTYYPFQQCRPWIVHLLHWNTTHSPTTLTSSRWRWPRRRLQTIIIIFSTRRFLCHVHPVTSRRRTVTTMIQLKGERSARRRELKKLLRRGLPRYRRHCRPLLRQDCIQGALFRLWCHQHQTGRLIALRLIRLTRARQQGMLLPCRLLYRPWEAR